MGLHGETVVLNRITLGEPDDDGIQHPTSSSTPIFGCNVQQRQSDEAVTDGTSVAGDAPDVLRVSTSALAEEIRSSDTITWRGRSYSVWGKPAHFYAVRPHTEFNMREE